MKNAMIFTMMVGGLALAGCAGAGADYRPIVDGPMGANYSSDLAICQELATERRFVNGDTKTKAAVGAGIGALAGIADDDVNDTEGAIAGAIVGGLVGGGSGMLETRDERRQVVIECMKGRGHRVVG